MLNSEILSKIKKIELRSKKLVDDVFSGKYHSVFKGHGIEFSEVREYAPGDDIRRISWSVTARRDRAYIKKYDEDREQTVMFVIDLSASGHFGSRNITKNELIAELTSVLAFSALKNNDRAGLLAFTDIVEKYIKPKKNKKHILKLIDIILSYQPHNKQTNIENADIKIISQKGNSIIGTTRLITNEVRPNEEVKKFSHLFVFKSQKVGASWKVANMLEAEAKLMNK